MTNRRLLLLSSLLVLLGSGAFAQGDREINWPAVMGPPATFGRSLAGDLSGDGVADVVVLEGTQAIYLYDPQVHGVVVDIPIGPVTDIDMIQGRPPLAPARLVCAQANTLLEVTLVEVPGSDPVELQFQSELIFAGPWSSVDLVRAVDLDGDGDMDFLGVADGNTVFQVLDDNNGVHVAGYSFGALDEVIDLEAMRWSTPGLELAVHTAVGVQVYGRFGDPRHDVRNAYSGNSLAVIHTAGKLDRLAWETRSGEELLLTLDVNAPSQYQGPIHFDFSELSAPPADVGNVVAVVGCDHDGDQKSDVVMIHQGAHEALVFPNQDPALPTIRSLPLAPIVYGPPGPAPNQFARPAAADLNHDGVEDLLIPVQADACFALRLGPFPDAGVLESSSSEFSLLGAEFCCDPGTTLNLNVAFEDPSLLTNHVNVVIWRQGDPAQRLQTEAIANFLFPVEDPVSELTDFLMAIPIEEPCEGTDAPFTALLNFELRLVKANATGVQKVVSKTYTGCFSSLPSLLAAGHTGPVDVLCPVPGAAPPGGVIVGGFVPFSDLPCFADGVIPVLPDPVVQE